MFTVSSLRFRCSSCQDLYFTYKWNIHFSKSRQPKRQTRWKKYIHVSTASYFMKAKNKNLPILFTRDVYRIAPPPLSPTLWCAFAFGRSSHNVLSEESRGRGEMTLTLTTPCVFYIIPRYIFYIYLAFLDFLKSLLFFKDSFIFLSYLFIIINLLSLLISF